MTTLEVMKKLPAAARSQELEQQKWTREVHPESQMILRVNYLEDFPPTESLELSRRDADDADVAELEKLYEQIWPSIIVKGSR